MALSDPQTVTISGTAIPLPRTFAEGDESAYTSADGLVKLSISHTLAKQGRARRLLRIDHSKLTSDPFKPSENVKVNMANYVVFDVPPAGYTNTEILAVYTGFKNLYTASTDAMITKLLGGES
ncbi:TPA_asm: coat protein [ssRNA phage Zoerhiza.2_20]|jgi:hypothetical protein|uniref:Coat protein n=2 Tax=Leviviricetes TaxID=2842243 RepID=A0A8S5L1M8_9VIRU|nr:coat protein [ssRNA phage Zoerhiza.2_20]QDH89238.1 MAG: hypothetical protein H2Rhizo33304_000003 [Leviviridae sp.]DAD51387.1 TPA_asm: coat protein [ssRNA phage Zoerhiza.2_20]